MTTLWKPRQPLHPLFADIQGCLDDDWFLLEHEIALQRAHGRALLAAGIFGESTHAGLLSALDEIAAAAGATVPESDAEDLHSWIEAEITARCAEAGSRIHTGRSRNDQVATLLLMHLRDAGETLLTSVDALIASLVRRADDWADLQMPLQTHLQFAAPGSVGAWPLRYASALTRTRRLLAFHVEEWSRWCPLGAGALAGSSVPLDREIQAAELGFDAPWPSSLDATSSRDGCLEMLAACTQLALHLQSLATDGQLFAQTPVAFTFYPDALATGSSMMPNKRNPDALELLRGEACVAAGAHTQAVMLLKGLPSGYQRDLQCLKPLVRDVPAAVRDLVELAQVYVDGVEFDPEALARAMELGDIGATLRMESRVLEGEALRQVHHAESDGPAGAAVAADARAYRTFAAASPEGVRAAAARLT